MEARVRLLPRNLSRSALHSAKLSFWWMDQNDFTCLWVMAQTLKP